MGNVSARTKVAIIDKDWCKECNEALSRSDRNPYVVAAITRAFALIFTEPKLVEQIFQDKMGKA